MEINLFELPALDRSCVGLTMKDPPVLIAIIDDDPSVCRALERLIRSFGMRASTFPSGESFPDGMAALEKPDCVVVDVQLPGLNGIQVHQHMVQDRVDIPVIFITAHMSDEVADRVTAAGAIGFSVSHLPTAH